MGERESTQNVNQPMGEAYSAYWNKWLQKGASIARRKLAMPAAELNSPLEVFDQLYEQAGGQAVFELARANGQMPGFDVQSLLFSTAPNPATLVQRWQKVAQAQANIRFGGSSSLPDFVQYLPEGDIVLSPNRIRPANLSKFGTAMLTGVAVHAIGQLTNAELEVWECSKAGRTQKASTLDFDPTSDIILRPSITPDMRNKKTSPSPYLHLNHLFDHQSHQHFRRMIQLLEHQGEGHLNIELCAHALGTSVRTLSRRLKMHSLSYGQVTRFVRLRKAVRLIHSGQVHMDDVAFHANYADRHHMARDFRQMIQIPPTLLRDLFADSPAKSQM